MGGVVTTLASEDSDGEEGHGDATGTAGSLLYRIEWVPLWWQQEMGPASKSADLRDVQLMLLVSTCVAAPASAGAGASYGAADSSVAGDLEPVAALGEHSSRVHT